MITKERASELASQWGSLIRAGDPGACMYAFHFNDGRPVSEEHRQRCLGYLKACRAHFAWDERELRSLVDFITTAPLYGAA